MMAAGPAMDVSHATKCELASEVICSFGKLRLQVTGWSMLPTVWPGDTLLLERAEISSVGEGDIVLFSREKRLFAHRVVGSSNHGFLTRGDAMATPDIPVDKSAVLGRVSHIIRDGRSIEPRKALRVGERVVASLVQYSEIAARFVVGVRELTRSSKVQTA
jgi:signal peptidase I